MIAAQDDTESIRHHQRTEEITGSGSLDEDEKEIVVSRSQFGEGAIDIRKMIHGILSISGILKG